MLSENNFYVHGLLRDSERAKVSYEIETVTVRKYESNIPDHLKEFYAIQSIPVVSRNRVEVSIGKAGETHWTIEELEPERKIPDGKHNIPPDLSSKVKKTEIFNNQASYYDADNKLLYRAQVDMPDMTQINEFLKNAGGMESAQDIDINQRIEFARQRGSRIYEHANGNLPIRTKQRIWDIITKCT